MAEIRDNTRPRALLTRREAGATMLGLLGAGLTSCGPVRAPRVRLGGKGAARLSVSSPRIDAVPGRMLVMPVRVDGPLPGSTAPRLTLAGGGEILASLVWIGLETDAAAWSGWLPSVERWVVTPVSEGAIPASVGAWHVVADLPPDAAGQSLRLAERTIPVNWLAAPEDLRPGTVEDGGEWAPWGVPEGSPEPDPGLLASEWSSPLRRWRARLATGGLGAPPPVRGLWQVRGDPAVLDGLADLVEARWRVGLARLWYADAEASRQLLARLARTVEFSPGVHAPAWPANQPMLDSLLTDLLDPGHTGEALVTRTQAWIEALPHAAAWVADDAAGLLGADSEPLVQLRAACLADQPLLMWVGGRDGLRVGEPQVLEPGRVGEVAVATGLGSPLTGASGFAVRCGGETLSIAAREAISIRPPGASCGPLLHDWTLESWSSSQPGAGATPGAGWTAGVLVFRDDSVAGGSGWSAFVECAADRLSESPSGWLSDPVSGAPVSDEVTLCFGQRGSSAAVLRVSRDGVLHNDRLSGGETVLEVADEGDRWSVSVPIPREAIEPGGMVRLGLTRRDARGVRTAWPRRMMPWESEPPRAAIDLKTWSGFSTP